MIKSMTGYGRAREMRNKRDITVEVRSVNNRYLDCTVKMPRMYSFAEDAVKQCVQKAISRGKVDVFITVDASAADVAKVTVNRELAAQYAAALAELSEVCGTESKVTPEQLSRFPDVLTVTKEDEEALKRYLAMFEELKRRGCRLFLTLHHFSHPQWFQEKGEFRKRVQFMYGGKLQKIRFKYTGPSIEAVLDRLPTADIEEKTEDGWIVRAEVFGKGIEMWLRSQGEYISLMGGKNYE